MKIRTFALAACASAAVLLAACTSKPAADTPAAPPSTEEAYAAALREALSKADSAATPGNLTDSLAFYLGVCEGMAYQDKLLQASEDQRADLNNDDYLYGLHSVLANDTLTTSYASGVRLGAETARYIGTLEAQGVRINRRILASTITTMLDNPALDSITKNHADSIAGEIIRRHQKL